MPIAPLPYTVDTDRIMNDETMAIEDSEGYIVANVQPSFYNDVPLQADNARLLVKAANHHDALVAALKQMREHYGRLHDALSDCIESGRLKRGDVADDYEALVELSAACVGADHIAKTALDALEPQTCGHCGREYDEPITTAPGCFSDDCPGHNLTASN